MKVSVESLTTAPANVAYATSIDMAGWPRFVAGVKSIEMLDEGPMRVGARFRETRIMFGREASEDMTIAALDAPRRHVLTAESHGARYVTTTEFFPRDGGTLMRRSFEATPVSLFARLFSVLSRLMAKSLRQHLQSDLDCLAREAARRASA